MSLPDKRDRISHRAPRLLWQQVYDDLISDIRSGALAVDDRLPSELDMAEQYGVSRDVIRRAKEPLADEGWFIVLHGRGTFVARPRLTSIASSAGSTAGAVMSVPWLLWFVGRTRLRSRAGARWRARLDDGTCLRRRPGRRRPGARHRE
jgi:DNA-binding transcriptional regulator YhcF (GntR family)